VTAKKGFLYENTNHSDVRILVFGAGALGSFVGGLLSKKNDVILIGRKRHVEAIQENGLVIRGKTDTVVRPQAKEQLDGNEAPEWVMVATKSYDTEDAMRALNAFHEDAVFLSLQNGLGNEEVISRYARRVVGGVTSHGITMDRPGRIIHAGIGRTVLGDYQGAEGRAAEMVEALTEAGIETEKTDDIRTEIWKKVIVNAGINPLSAITGQKNGFILESPDLERTLEAICLEAVAVANAHGIDISSEEAVEQAKEVARLTAENKSSMLQDIERGRRTEIDSICGAIMNLGEAGGILTPFNSAMFATVKGIESTGE
jgi:2-dehydropantoate 2-reductase